MEDSKKSIKKVIKKDLEPKEVAELGESSASELEKPLKVAKSGKRSIKAQTEASDKEAKEAKKIDSKKSIEVPKTKQKPRVKKYTKNQKSARDMLEKDKLYTLAEAMALLPKISKVKFDATAELHATLNIDPRQADQMVRTNISLPAGTGKTLVVAVISGENESEAAKKAGADFVDGELILKEIAKEKFNFDILIASPDKMSELGKLAKILGPKGLMPSPKNGTVTADPAKAVDEFKKGKVEIKNDANGVIHVAIGKLSFKPEDLYSNARSVVKALSSAKPSGVKGVFIRNIYITSSMSPSIRLDHNEALREARQK